MVLNCFLYSLFYLLKKINLFFKGKFVFSPKKKTLFYPGEPFEIDLQFFATAEDEGRTEDPTETKKRKSREEGKVPKSQDLSGIIVVLFTFWAIAIFSDHIMKGVTDLFKHYLGHINEIVIDKGSITAFLTRVIFMLLKIILPVISVAMVIAIGANVLQVGFLFTWKPLKPDLKKISFTPKKVFEKILFSKQSMMNLLKSLLKIAGVGIVAYLIISSGVPKFINLINMGVKAGLDEITTNVFALVNASGVVLGAAAIVDYIFQRKQHAESLKMSASEKKQEHKQEEGDPLVKQRIMQRGRELAQRNLVQEVQKADVIVTNPTHIAIALKYDLNMHAEPVVVAKGQDHLAHKIREVAIEADVPIIENKSLAWAMYDIEIGDAIPEDLFEAVVAIYNNLQKFQAMFS